MTIIEGYEEVIVVNTFVTVEDVNILRCLALLTVVLFTENELFCHSVSVRNTCLIALCFISMILGNWLSTQ